MIYHQRDSLAPQAQLQLNTAPGIAPNASTLSLHRHQGVTQLGAAIEWGIAFNFATRNLTATSFPFSASFFAWRSGKPSYLHAITRPDDNIIG